jgi:hypothetical protein
MHGGRRLGRGGAGWSRGTDLGALLALGAVCLLVYVTYALVISHRVNSLVRGGVAGPLGGTAPTLAQYAEYLCRHPQYESRYGNYRQFIRRYPQYANTHC